MRICIDLDNTLCTGKPYQRATPFPGAADFLRKLKSLGIEIIINTARGMGSQNGNIGKVNKSITKLTLDQLETWGFVYDEIYFGKPSADFYLDDKNIMLVNYEQVLDTIKQCQEIETKHNKMVCCS